MSVLQLRTYADIYTAVREEIQLPSTDSTAISRIKRDINIIYQEACAAHKWRWLKGFRDLTLPAYVSLGTVSVTQGSNQVTLSQPIAASKTGFKFSVQGFMEVYTISYHAAGSSTFSLDTNFNGASNPTATYQIWTDRIPLPTDAREVTEAWCDIYRQNLDTTGLQEYRRMVSLSPKNQGRPFVYYVGDYVDPTQLQTIPSLPSLQSRSSNGVIKTLVFNSALPTSVVTSITNGDPVKWNVSNASESSYNGDILVSSIGQTNLANDTITYTGLSPYQESPTADTAMAFASLSQEQSYNRYREMFLYPCLTNTNTAIHVDYVKEILPLNNDDDEPLMPVEDRIVLLYGALARAWTRARNETEAARNRDMYDKKLAQMAGKLQGDFDKPKLQPSKMYLSSKRNQVRKSQVESSSPFGFGGSGGGSNPTGPGNTVAIFNGNGDLNGSSVVSTTVLNYLQGLTGNVQAQIDAAASAELSQGNIFVGNTQGVAAGVPMSGDVSINTTGATTVLTVGGATDTSIASAASAVAAATNADTASTIVKRDSSGNFSAGTITANLSGNASTATTATSATTATTAGNITATSNNTLTTLSALALPGSQVTGNISGNAANITASSNSTLTTLSALSLPGSQVSGNIGGHASLDLQASNNLSDVSSKATAFNNVSPITSTGDIIIGTGTNAAGRLAIGSNNTVLTSNGTTASWAAAGTASPLTTKGDTYGFSTTNARIPVGSDYQSVIADSNQALGLRYTNQYKGAKNLIIYSDFENGVTTGWSTFSTTLTNGVPTGAIGAGSGTLTLTANTTSPVSGTCSLKATTSGALAAGQGFISQVYSNDASDQARVFTGSFNYITSTGAANINYSGTSASSFQIYLYDFANSTWIQPAGCYGITQSSGVGHVTFTFQTPANASGFQLAILCTNATSGATAMSFDDFFLGPQTAPLGAVCTDWVAYTPTFTGFGTPTAVSFFSRRVGDTLWVRGNFTSGTSTAATAAISLGYNGGNANVSSDSTKSPNGSAVGSGYYGTAQAATAVILTSTALTTTVNIGIQQSATAGATPQPGSSILSSGGALTVFFQVPITGWSSNVQMSSDTDTRVIAFIGSASGVGISNAAITQFTTITASQDTAGGYSNNAYKVPVSGFYDLNLVCNSASSSGGGNLETYYQVNSAGWTKLTSANYNSSVEMNPAATELVKLNAGDSVIIGAQQSTFGGSFAVSAYWSMCRRSGPSVIAATESVNARYTSSGSQTLTNGTATLLSFGTKSFDSHSAFSSGTTYTAPVSGKYLVNAFFTSSLSNGSSVNQFISIYKNSSSYSSGGQTNMAATAMASPQQLTSAITDSVSCNAGDTIQLYGYISNGNPVSGTAVFNIERVGN